MKDPVSPISTGITRDEFVIILLVVSGASKDLVPYS